MPISKTYRVFAGICPDEKCRAKLFFPSYDTSIECTACGQRHERQVLKHLEEITDPIVAFQNMLRHVVVGTTVPKKGAEMVKVLGLSNYHCKLLSPFLTYYGMDKKTGKAILLRDKNREEIFDCSVLGDLAFVIDPEHIDIVGYGRDISGSAAYLGDTQKRINAYSSGEENLIPIHADGDGHCLVHAISRALVGRELFWHPLRINLKIHFQKFLPRYKELFKDFIDVTEWQDIIAECDPDFQPPDGELLGLRNIHVFGLANVLRRPILLLDSLSGMQSSGDYSALFLPGLVEPKDCRSKKSGELNKPLCIAWSSPGRNHYIPLVGIKRARLPRLPRHLVPKPWGISENLVNQYLEFDQNDLCIIGGDKCLQDNYILRLAAAMDEVFMNKHRVHPALVADVHHYVYKRTGVVGAHLKEVLFGTQRAVHDRRLYRCFTCDAISELTGKPSLDAEEEDLISESGKPALERCTWCHGSTVRLVNADGSIQYRNGDRTRTKTNSTLCDCGFKHYWDGKEYDNLPQIISVSLEWGNKEKAIVEKVPWFQSESDPSLNSNVYDVANGLIQKHFPGVFGSERLVQKVVDQILEQTKKPEKPEVLSDQLKAKPRESSPSKIIITGYKTLHKEELTMSDAERQVKHRIETNASLAQRKSVEKHQRRKSVPSPRKLSSSSLDKQSTSQVANERPERSVSPDKTIVTANMIRVVTSDGKQSLRLPLNAVGTYSSFCETLQLKLGVPCSHQRIMYGFPPKELQPPLPGNEDAPLPFQHGDKVTVEVLLDLSAEQEVIPKTRDLSQQSFDDSMNALSSSMDERLWHKLSQDLANSANSQNLNLIMTTLMLSTSFNKRRLWSIVQTKPELFVPGGLFYAEVERDVGLVDGKHFTLPFISDKIFQFNAAKNRIELCVEPIGHFAIGPDLDERIAARSDSRSNPDHLRDDASVAGSSSMSTSATAATMAGSSGVVLSKSKELLASHTPFQGQGYVLSQSMEKQSLDMLDLDYADESMDDMTEVSEVSEMQHSATATVDIRPPEEKLPMIRKGPGVSIINPEVTNFTNMNVERLQVLAQSIKEKTDESDGIKRQSKGSVTTDVMMSETLSDTPHLEQDRMVTDSPQHQRTCDDEKHLQGDVESSGAVEMENVDTEADNN